MDQTWVEFKWIFTAVYDLLWLVSGGGTVGSAGYHDTANTINDDASISTIETEIVKQINNVTTTHNANVQFTKDRFAVLRMKITNSQAN